MAPAFGLVEVKSLLPHFMNVATKVRELRLNSILRVDQGPRCQMADKWSNIIANDKSGRSATIDVCVWLGKATLDACVQYSALSVCGPRVNRKAISQKDRCRSLRVRFRRLR